MSDSIKLSPKHGVNPTIPLCFFCGEEKGEIALLGKIGKRDEDIEAPMYMILDYEPCDKCKENMKQGITLVGVTDKQPSDNRLPIQEGLYPTGAWCVMKEEAVERIFNLPDEEMDKVKNIGKMLIDQKVLENLIAKIANAQSKE